MKKELIQELLALAKNAEEGQRNGWPFYPKALASMMRPEVIRDLCQTALHSLSAQDEVLTDEQAWTIITEICGTQLTRVGSRKFQVVEINDMATAGEIARALLAAAPAPIQQEPVTTHKRQVFMDEIDAAAAGSEWLQPFFTPNFSLCFSVDEGARAPRAKWCMLFDSLDRVVAGYILTRDAKNWTELTKFGPHATPPALAGSQVQAAGDAVDAARWRAFRNRDGFKALDFADFADMFRDDADAVIDAAMREQP